MAPIIFDCVQNSKEWFEARRGIPTASEFDSIVKKLKNGGYSEKRKDYLHKLAGEIYTGDLAEMIVAKNLERGKAFEEEARDGYSFISGNDVKTVGFVRNGDVGCSPDGLIDDNGGAE